MQSKGLQGAKHSLQSDETIALYVLSLICIWIILLAFYEMKNKIQFCPYILDFENVSKMTTIRQAYLVFDYVYD